MSIMDPAATRSEASLSNRLALLIVGSQKAGTTGLVSLMACHPAVATSAYSETVWLSDSGERGRPPEWAAWKYFGDAEDHEIWLGKDIELFLHAEGLEKGSRISDDLVAVTVIRNPIARARSAYWYNRMRGEEQSTTLEQAIESARARGRDQVDELEGSRRHGYLFNGHYRDHIDLVDQYFGEHRHCVIVAEDLFEDWAAATSDLFAQLDLSVEDFSSEDIASRHVNAGGRARFPLLAKAMRLQPLVPQWVKAPLRRVIGPARIARTTRWFDKANRKSFKPPPLEDETRRWMSAYFKGVNGDLTDRVRSEQAWVRGDY